MFISVLYSVHVQNLSLKRSRVGEIQRIYILNICYCAFYRQVNIDNFYGKQTSDVMSLSIWRVACYATC